MAFEVTTPGRLLLKEALPERYHPYLEGEVLDKKRLRALFSQMSREEEPEAYRQILQNLNEIGEEIASTYGTRGSLTVDSFLSNEELASARATVEENVQEILDSDLPPREKDKRLLDYLQTAKELIRDEVVKALEGTAFGAQMAAGVRGKPDQLTNIIAGQIFPVDEEGNPIPLPVTRGYSEGLTPAQYWATSQKARTGLIGVKLATPEAGDISNQILRGVHRLRVTRDKEPVGKHGLPVDPTDPDYEGSILARDVPGIAEAGSKLTPRLMQTMKGRGIEQVLIHSPITSRVEYGISREAAGSALGEPFPVGSFAGVQAAQALSEPFTQMNIGSKHVGTRSSAGLDALKKFISVPSHFPGGAAVSEVRGKVQSVEDSPTGGKVITVKGIRHPVPMGTAVKVKPGQVVRKGEIMSEGMPNPAKLTELLGVGEGRRQFAQAFSRLLKDSGVEHNKRNAEYIARGLVNHARMTEPYGRWLPNDLVEFSELMRNYEPREGAEEKSLRYAEGGYLEEPIAHFTVGTQLTKGMVKDLKDLGFSKTLVHPDPPPFKPEMRRAREALRHAPDWLTRMAGSGIKRSTLKALHGGDTPASPEEPTALIPQLVFTGKPKELG